MFLCSYYSFGDTKEIEIFAYVAFTDQGQCLHVLFCRYFYKQIMLCSGPRKVSSLWTECWCGSANNMLNHFQCLVHYTHKTMSTKHSCTLNTTLTITQHNYGHATQLPPQLQRTVNTKNTHQAAVTLTQ